MGHNGTMMLDVTELGLLEDEEIELDLAALALSALDHEGVDLDRYLELLDDIEDSLAQAGDDALDPTAQGEALARVFSGEFGFTGDTESYDAPLNADLIRVLDRRRGLPVILSLLYVAIARRLGWPAFVLNTPGQVLVRLGTEPFVIVDPFNHGRLVDDRQLRRWSSSSSGRAHRCGPNIWCRRPTGRCSSGCCKTRLAGRWQRRIRAGQRRSTNA